MSGVTARGPLRAVALALAALVLGGCAGDLSDLEAWVQEVRARQKGRIEPLPEVKPYETFAYAAQDLRDPFTPPSEEAVLPVLAGGGSKVRPDLNRPREPLESYPLDSLRMVGVLELKGTRWALIKTPDDTIHRVRVGNYMGQNHGRITRITETEVDLIEIVPDGLGGWMERKAKVALAEPAAQGG